jgi:hypothetical protein
MRSIAALLISIACWNASLAADFSKIDRTIRKEPTYQSKSPKYCLLVFGPEATARVWLVLDGDALYVDRNGNGDLTEDGERIGSVKVPPRMKAYAQFFFDVRNLEPMGGKVHRKYPRMAVMRVKERGYSIVLELGGGRLQCSFDDRLQWSDRPKDAPILHFDGPLTLALASHAQESFNWYVKPGEKTELHALIGTPGAGKHTFVGLQHGQWTLADALDADPDAKPRPLVPEGVHPLAEIEFPSKAPGGLPFRVKAVLRDRC